MLKLYYNIYNLIRFCKHGDVVACHVVWEYAVESAGGQLPDDDLKKIETCRTDFNCLSVLSGIYVSAIVG